MAKKDPGKEFEKQFKKSCDKIDELFVYRLKDGTASWDKSKDGKTRFQATNICDTEVFYKNNLFMLELKSVKDVSIPFDNFKTSQIDGLTDAYQRNVPNLHTGFLINFRKNTETYYLTIKQFNDFVSEGLRKSIPLNFCRDNGIIINCRLKKIKYDYYVEEFLNKIIELEEMK
jgi:recombination protein U